jgi:putative phosphoesterase
MRLAVISDIHASLAALEAVLADARDQGADKVVCLGDIVDLGPEPSEVVERLRQAGIPCVGGNHDPLDEHPTFPLLARVEDWSVAQLSDEQRAWLESLPDHIRIDLDGLDVLCVHGSPRSNTDDVQDTTPPEQLRQWWGSAAFDVMLCGHTHVPLLRRVEDRLVVNVGSVGQPFFRVFDGSPPRVLPWSEYALLDHHQGALSVVHRRVPFDLGALEAALRASGFPDPDGWLTHWTR